MMVWPHIFVIAFDVALTDEKTNSGRKKLTIIWREYLEMLQNL